VVAGRARATICRVTDGPTSREDPALRLALVIALVLAALATPALVAAASPPPPGSAAIAQAQALAARWGRCPTAPAAQRVLDEALRTTAPRPRARRARAAVRAWTAVARACSEPVDQPSVTVSG